MSRNQDRAVTQPSMLASLPAVWVIIRPYRIALIYCFILMVVSQVARLFLPFSTKYLIDEIVLKHHPDKLGWLVAATSTAAIIDAISMFALLQLQPRTAESAVKDLRKQLQAHTSRLPLSYFDRNLSGVLVSRIMSDVEGLKMLCGPAMLQFCMGLLTALMALIILFTISSTLTVIIAGLLVCASLALRKAMLFTRPILARGNELKSYLSGRLTESIGGVRTVKSYRAEVREADRFAEGAHSLFANAVRSWVGFGTVNVIGSLTVGVTTIFLTLVGGKHLLAHRWSLGDYIQYAAILAYLVEPLHFMMNYTTQFAQSLTSLERITAILSEVPEDADERRTTKLPTLSGRVRFDDVSFSYEPQKQTLHGVSFVAEPGTVSALVGRSGSGKSTIISLLCGFYSPDRGRILIDGVDLATATLDSYRTQLGLVLQDTFLFDGSIRQNILFSRPDANEECFLRACQISHVKEFVDTLPDSFETMIGERGIQLSGGQRQRLSLARAIIADPKILILDEATSSLDSESESMIQRGLKHMMKDRTTFVIAHRLSTIREADQILVVENGSIVESGTHDMLYALSGRYFQLYTQQYGTPDQGPAKSVSERQLKEDH